MFSELNFVQKVAVRLCSVYSKDIDWILKRLPTICREELEDTVRLLQNSLPSAPKGQIERIRYLEACIQSRETGLTMQFCEALHNISPTRNSMVNETLKNAYLSIKDEGK